MAALALPGALEQILDNYLANALAAAPAGSTVTVRTRSDGHRVTIEVVDEGPGMSDDHRRRAFDRFWRGNTQHTEGFGLGLSIVARLATASGGHARLDPGPSDRGIAATIILEPAPGSGREQQPGSERVRHPTTRL